MLRLKEFFGKDACYFGDNGEFFVVYDYSRDSSLLELSNVQAIKKLFGIDGKKDKEFPTDLVIERASHWAVGWVEYILVNPENAEFVGIGEKIEQSLKDYPILDEGNYTDLQYEEYENSLSEAIRDYSLKYDREFDIEKYHSECVDCAFDREYTYIGLDDLEEIEGTQC